MSFLHNLHAFGAPAQPLRWGSTIDPLERKKRKFVSHVQTQIEICQRENWTDSRSWFKRVQRPDGRITFFASLRNGKRIMPLNDASSRLEIASLDLLVEFFKGAIAACESGELDQLLAQTMSESKGGA